MPIEVELFADKVQVPEYGWQVFNLIYTVYLKSHRWFDDDGAVAINEKNFLFYSWVLLICHYCHFIVTSLPAGGRLRVTSYK